MNITTNYMVQCDNPWHCGVICEHALPHVHDKGCDMDCGGHGGHCIPVDVEDYLIFYGIYGHRDDDCPQCDEWRELKHKWGKE